LLQAWVSWLDSTLGESVQLFCVTHASGRACYRQSTCTEWLCFCLRVKFGEREVWGMAIIQASATLGVNLIFCHLLHSRTVENTKTFPEVAVFLI